MIAQNLVMALSVEALLFLIFIALLMIHYKDLIRRLRDLAVRDPLTGLLNRRGFNDSFERFLEEAFASRRNLERRSASVETVSLAILDIDRFKELNDTYGHDAGDKVLRVLSELLTKLVRDFDFVARWGGEEFIIGLIGANEDDATRIVEKIRTAVEELEVPWRGETLHFTVSAGVASSDQTENFEGLIWNADKALYEAKRVGRNWVVKHSFRIRQSLLSQSM